MKIGKDYSNIPEVPQLYYKQDRSIHSMPGIKRIGEFIRALEEQGEPIFKIKVNKMPVSEADLKDSWMDIQNAGWSIKRDWDTSMSGFNEVYICTSDDWGEMSKSPLNVIKSLRQLEQEIFDYTHEDVDLVSAYCSLKTDSDRDKVKRWILQEYSDRAIDFLTSSINESLNMQNKSNNDLKEGKKKKKSFGAFCTLNPDAGDVEKNIDIFNDAVSDNMNTPGLSEQLETTEFGSSMDGCRVIETYIEEAPLRESWQNVYKQFEDIVDEEFPFIDNIEQRIDDLYAKHEGEEDWDEAYKRWQSSMSEEDLDELDD